MGDGRTNGLAKGFSRRLGTKIWVSPVSLRHQSKPGINLDSAVVYIGFLLSLLYG